MKLRRVLAGFALALLVVVAAWWPSDAWAVDDSIDSWQVSYNVGTDGVLHVQETLVYRFGSYSGRHGIDRVLITREPWGSEDQDAVYTISNIQVSSPDAPANFTTTTQGSGRDQQLRIRIGSSNQIVVAATASYTLRYDVGGAMRTSGDYDELYWDAIGDNTPQVDNIAITVQVPGGVQDVACYAGPATTNQPCTSAEIDSAGVATYTEASKAAGDIVTIGAKIAPGLVADNAPHLVPRADQASVAGRRLGLAATGGTAAVTVLGVSLLARRGRRDERFLGVAPGTIETSGQRVGPDDHPTIPVAFNPPDIPVAAAGLIDDGAVDVRDTTATLLSLAVRGVIQLRQAETRPKSWVFGGAGEPSIYARLVRRGAGLAPHEEKLLRDIFPGSALGQEEVLTGPGTLYQAHQNMQRNVRAEAKQAGWYVRMPDSGVTAAAAGGGAATASLLKLFAGVFFVMVFFGGSSLIGLIIGSFAPNFRWLIWGGPLAVLLIGFLVYKGLTRRGQRSAVGRAYADQVTGFREYLTTAEADQIKFEEGEDIFSQYLPWAVIFGVTDRWTKVCAQLVAEGRLANIQPAWYYGDYRFFNVYLFTNSLGRLDQAAMPVAQASSWSSSGSGFGGGSSFSFGGGFSGGGGGGGGASSW